jgi:hypothetical protein
MLERDVPLNIRLYCIEVLIHIYRSAPAQPYGGVGASGLTALGWRHQGNLKTLHAPTRVEPLMGWSKPYVEGGPEPM